MRRHLIAATGYLLPGAADNTTPTTIHSITVIPGNPAGSFKIEKGVAGGAGDLYPSNDAVIPTLSDGQPYQIKFNRGLFSEVQIYVTISNCSLVVEHG